VILVVVRSITINQHIMSVNLVLLSGRVTKDPVKVENFECCRFSVATNKARKKEDGTWDELTEFHNVVAWNYNCEKAMKRLKKGDLVTLQGELHTSTYKKGEVTCYSTSIIANIIDVPDRPKDQLDQSQPPMPSPGFPSGDETNDLPF